MPGASTHTVLTWNIRHGGGTRTDRILRAVKRRGADTLVLTEFRNNVHGRRIRDRLKTWGYTAQYAPATTPRVNTVLIASKCTFDVIGEYPHLCAAHRHRLVEIAFLAWDLIGGYFPSMDEKFPVFEALIRRMRETNGRPTLFIGDTNTGKNRIDEIGAVFTGWQYIEQIEQLGWTDLWRCVHGDRREYTWYSHTRNGFRLDHAYGSPAFTNCLHDCRYHHSLRTSGISDHSAMLVEHHLSREL